MAITGLTVTAQEVRDYNNLTDDITDERINIFIDYGLTDFIDFIGIDSYTALPTTPQTIAEEVKNKNAKEALINFTLSKLMPTVSSFTMGDLPTAQDEFRDITMYSAEEQNTRTDRFREMAEKIAEKVMIKSVSSSRIGRA